MVAKRGDVLIRRWRGPRFELLDAITHQRLGTSTTARDILALAATHRGAVWQEDIGADGRPTGAPVRILLGTT